MKKIKMIPVIGIAVVLIAALIILPSCTPAEEGTMVETVTETVVETVYETVEVTAENPYTFEALREMAKSGEPYEGAPAAGHTIAFQNILKGYDFFDLVENSIVEQWELAGGNPDDLTLLVNDNDATKAAQNADIIYSKHPEVWIQFYGDEKANTQWARRSKEEGIFMIAIDIPVSGFPFMGVDNYYAGQLAGEFAVDYINNVWGGWDTVDLVGSEYAPAAGAVVALRTLVPLDYLIEAFGEEAAYDTNVAQVEGSKVVLVDSNGTPDAAKEAWSNILAANPDAERIVSFNINTQGTSGVYAAAETLGRWDADNWLLMMNGCDDLGQELLRAGTADADVGYFPETYGEYLIPAALAQMYGNPVPSDIYIDHVIITLDNLDEYYPQ